MSKGPEDVARAWVEAVMDRGDLGAAWPITDQALRLVLAQHWILSRQDDAEVSAEDRDSLAEALAAYPPTHPFWQSFASQRLWRWREFWGTFRTGKWDVAGERQPVATRVEVVTFMEKHRLLGWAKPGPPPAARRFAVRSTPQGWVVAGLDGSALFRPGWPPTQVRIDAG